jgi:hypothetical protein
VDVGQGLRAVAAVAAFGGLLEEFRQGRIVTRTAEREGMERHAGPLTASWNARFPGFPSDDFPYTSIRGELRRKRRDAYLIDVIVRMLAGRRSVETTLVNVACVFGWQACLLATRLPEAHVIGADIDPRWDRLHRLWRGRRLPSNYRFVRDNVFSPRLGVRPTAVVFFGACGAVSDAAMDYAVNAGADYLMCRTCCHDNIGGNLAITSRLSYLNWFFRFKNFAYGRLEGVPKYAGYYFSPAYDSCAYPRSSAGKQLSSTEELMAVARSSPESDICRAIIDLDRCLYLAERGFRVEYQGELIVAERSGDLLETGVRL